MADTNKVGWNDDYEIDWDDVSTTPPPPIDPGYYTAQIVEAKAEPTSKGKPCVLMTVDITGSADGQNEVEGRNTKIRYERVMLTTEAAWRAKQLGESSGCMPPRAVNFGAISEWAEELVGRDVFVKVRHGKPTAKGSFPEIAAYLTAEGVTAALEADAAPAPPTNGKRKRR